jgi:Spy/CpxP family protein refolding chaperone
MKTKMLLALVMMMAMSLTMVTYAQEDPPPPPPEGEQMQPPPPGGPMFGPGPRAGGRRGGPRGPGQGPEIGPTAILEMFDRISKVLPKQLELEGSQTVAYEKLVKDHRTVLEGIVKKLQEEKTKFETDLNAILTPDQQKKFKNMQERREKMMKQFKGPMERPGQMMMAIEKMDIEPWKAEKVKSILKSFHEKLRNTAQGDREVKKKVIQEMMDEIGKVLTPEEMDKLRAMIRENRQGQGREKGMYGGQKGGQRGFHPGGRRGGNQPPPPPPEDNDEY